MKETQEILLQMGFINPNDNVWKSEWFGVFLLLDTNNWQSLFTIEAEKWRIKYHEIRKTYHNY